MLSSDQSKKVIGELIVVALKARELPNVEVVGKQDPFCIFRLGEVAKKTKTDYRGGQRPVWDDQVNLPVPGNKTKMYVQVFDEDSSREELICEGEIDLTVVLRDGEQDQWFPLKYRGKGAGEIYLEMTFYSARAAPKRQPTRLYNSRPQGHNPQQQQQQHTYPAQQQQQYAYPPQQQQLQQQQQYPYYQPQRPYAPPVPVQSVSTPASGSSAGPPPYRQPSPSNMEEGHSARPHMPPRMSPSNSTSAGFPQMRPSTSSGTNASGFSLGGSGYPPQQGNNASLLSSAYRPPGRPASFAGGPPLGFYSPQVNFPAPQPGNYPPSYGSDGRPFTAYQAPYPPQQGGPPGYPPQPGYSPTSGAPQTPSNYPPQHQQEPQQQQQQQQQQQYGYPPY